MLGDNDAVYLQDRHSDGGPVIVAYPSRQYGARNSLTKDASTHANLMAQSFAAKGSMILALTVSIVPSLAPVISTPTSIFPSLCAL